MGKGDRKTRRGKIFIGSYGNSRLRAPRLSYRPDSLRNTNEICYVSQQKLTKENMSLEHVIPNALGGMLKSFRLMCDEWNEKLGKIDAELVRQIPLATLLGVKRDRGDNRRVQGESEERNKYLINEKLEVERLPSKPEIETLSDGKKVIKFIEGQEESILKSMAKKNPNLNIEELRRQITWDDTPRKTNVFFEHHLSLVSGYDAIRALCKIAANFYVLSSKEVSHMQAIVPFIKGEIIEPKSPLKYYYPEDKIIHALGSDEISHVIYVRGLKKERILYAYIELFSCHCFLVVLNYDYQGEDIECSYCYCVNNAKEIKKTIKLNLSRDEIRAMNFPQDKDSEKQYFKKLLRVGQMKGLELIERKIADLKK